MKIELHEIPRMTIEAFADEHGLVMEVHERKKEEGDPSRYYAFFKNSQSRVGVNSLACKFGNGPTPEDAIADYARTISLLTLIIDAGGRCRREIEVPRLVKREGLKR